MLMATVHQRIEETYATLMDQPFPTLEQISIIKKVLKLSIITFVDKDVNRTAELVHSDYKQHNPFVEDGWKSIIEFEDVMKQRFPLLSPVKEF
ncbi:hypothetical protein BGZ61DRAFT_537345 [Ilyonectria robusta]|uniref:uncharacterized protein n=1 Tax=Ilyonectria robusta TaxID=1079257 RepID=UPI001E8E9434|nr:uncharacterized protein BGZ61DRAFT_537345 [Ilyonectria robusta]KAH8670709.1 hypothetical protein BGZ61DRAFT_537345 [Ilyonectria robusta]